MSRTRSFCLMMTALFALTFFTSCSDEPDQEWAEAAYASEKASIDKVLSGLEAEYKKFKPTHYEELPKDEAGRKAEEERMKAASETFDKAAMKLLDGNPKLIGWEITYTYPHKDKPAIPYSFPEASSHVPAWKAGTVRAERRDVKKDGRKLGWGMYQISGKETKTNMGLKALNYYPGLEVDAAIDIESSVLNVTLFYVPEPDA